MNFTTACLAYNFESCLCIESDTEDQRFSAVLSGEATSDFSCKSTFAKTEKDIVNKICLICKERRW